MDRKWKIGLATLAGIALLVLLRRTLGRFALLLLVSATLATLLFPSARFFRRRLRFSEGASAAAAFALACCVLLALALLGLPALGRQAAALSRSAPQLVAALSALIARAAGALGELGLPEGMLAALEGQAGTLLALPTQFLLGRLTAVAGGVKDLGYLVFSPLIAFYMLKDRRRLFAFLTRLIPSRARRRVLQVTLAVRDAIMGYIRGQAAVSLITGALTAVGLLIIRLPAWLVMGAVMALCNLIPYFGPWLGAIPIMVFAAAQGLPMMLGGALVVLLSQQIENLLISPRVIGRAARLHPALVMLCLIAGGWIAGLPGMFYAIPAFISARAALCALRDAKLRL